MRCQRNVTKAVIAVAGIVLAPAFCVPTALAGDGTFLTQPPGSPFGVGNGPYSVAVGDFDNDGDEDLATANFGGNITVRLGAGDGTFATEPAGSPFAVGVEPASVAVGDFNNDGNEDLAAADNDSGTITVRLGAGDGTFAMQAAGSPFAAPDSPNEIAVGDFNNDGDEDLATAELSGGVAVRLGDGNGAFTTQSPGSPFATGNFPVSVTVGDFNNDGAEDLATANLNANNITVRLGAGDGTFVNEAPGSPFAVGNGPRSVAVGDFNNDGNEDLATANEGSDNVTVRLGTGDGSFATQSAGSPFAAGTDPFSVTFGDFNSDGNEDLATGNGGSDNITVRLGAGDGTFATQSEGSPFAAGDLPSFVAAGDFNSDGNQDLAAANLGSDNITIRLGAGLPADAGNLLANGGGEGAGTARTSSDSPVVPGWTDTSAFTHVRYGTSGGFPDRLISNRIIGQQGFLAGGPAAANTATSQTVDVSASAVSIDAGLASATLQGYLGGFRTSNDRMGVTATYRDAAGTALGTTEIAPVTATDRKNKTILLRRTASAAVPAGTRSIEVTLTAIRVNGAYNDAYADRIGLFLNAPAPPDPIVADTTIALDVSAKKSQKAAKFTLSAGCGAEPCQIATSGRLRLKKSPQAPVARVRFQMKPANVSVAAGATEKIRIKIKGKGALAELVALLRSGTTATAKPKITATDTAGNVAVRFVTVKLKP